MPTPSCRTWAEVSLATLIANLREARQRAAGAEVCAVVKCNAYGHGAAACAGALEGEGVQWFAVAGPEEGIELRKAGVGGSILLLSGFFPEQARDVIEYQLTPNVWESAQVQALNAAAAQSRKRVPIHVEIDTGMSRQGVPAHCTSALLHEVRSSQHLELQGVYQHYAAGEDCANESAANQEHVFAAVLERMQYEGFWPQYVHAANSGAVVGRAGKWQQLRTPGAKQLVRVGIALYGYHLPLEHNDGQRDNWTTQPILQWKTRVLSTREVPAGTPIGYSGAYTTTRRTRIAAVPVGYGDGLNRLLSSRGRVIVRGQYAPIIGNISMDMTMIDVTDIPGVAMGDEVLLLGSSGELSIDAWEHARLCGTIPYEILCDIAPRVKRMHNA
jgi:alanine racemase